MLVGASLVGHRAQVRLEGCSKRVTDVELTTFLEEQHNLSLKQNNWERNIVRFSNRGENQ